MKILLIDADSTLPNLALMRISSYYKKNGHSVNLKKAHIQYLPTKKNNPVRILTNGYDKTYCSVIFPNSMGYISGDGDIIYGGTGFDPVVKLPPEIASCDPDYSIYPENDISYGFLTRGCIRKCKFCLVPIAEGGIHTVCRPADVIRHKIVKFMDNNILASPDSLELLGELRDTGTKCEFNQGLDFRLLNEENTELLSQLNYVGPYAFAFDNISYMGALERKRKFLEHLAEKSGLRFFVYAHPDMRTRDTVERIEWIRKFGAIPYLMRDREMWNDWRSPFFIDYTPYCNSVRFFKKITFVEYVEKLYGRGSDRARFSSLVESGASEQECSGLSFSTSDRVDSDQISMII